MLNDLPGDFRIRLSSLEAAEARDDLVAALRDLPRVVPHLHLCLQSGSDAILARMKRRYRTAGFLERCRRIRQALDRPAFTTDVIVGFPGETEQDFEATLRVVREVGFCKVHVFSYSPREGTPAARFSDGAEPKIVADRRERLRDLEKDLASVYARSLVGSPLDVMVEGELPDRPGHASGTSCRYLSVTFPGHTPALIGKRVRIAIDGADNAVLRGTPAHDNPTIAPKWRLSINPAQRVSLPLAK